MQDFMQCLLTEIQYHLIRDSKNQYDGKVRKVKNWLDFHGETLKNRFNLDAYKTMNRFLSSIDVESYSNSSIDKLIKK